jgi:hypothetical protein
MKRLSEKQFFLLSVTLLRSVAPKLHQNKIVQEILKDENFLSMSEKQKLSILVDVYNILDKKRQRKFQELNQKNINRMAIASCIMAFDQRSKQ